MCKEEEFLIVLVFYKSAISTLHVVRSAKFCETKYKKCKCIIFFSFLICSALLLKKKLWFHHFPEIPFFTYLLLHSVVLDVDIIACTEHHISLYSYPSNKTLSNAI